MVYTQKTPATLIMGVIFAAYGYAVKAGMLGGMLSYLKVTKHVDEMIAISLTAGVIGILIGLWQMFMSGKDGHGDYYLSTVGGALFLSSFHFYRRIWRVKIRKRPCISSEDKDGS